MSLLFGSTSVLPTPAPVAAAPVPVPTAPPPASAVIANPTISGNGYEAGVTLTRVIGTYTTGWTPVAGRWTLVSSGAVIGNQATQTTTNVPAGDYVIYRETISKTGEVDQFAYSAAYGPFTAAAAAPPPSSAPPASGTVMDSAMVDRVINTSTGNGNNDGVIYPFADGWVYGWNGGSDWGFGSIFRKSEAGHNISNATTGYQGFNDSSWNNFMEMWMVFMHDKSNPTGLGEIDVKDVGMQILRKDTDTWEHIWRFDRTVGWAPRWEMRADGGQGYNPDGVNRGNAIVTINSGFDSVQIDGGGRTTGVGHACHFSMSSGFTEVNASNVKNFVVSARVRRGANSQSNHTGLVHMGLDPKFIRNAGDSGLWWTGGYFPNAVISRSIRLTSSWQDLFICALSDGGSARRPSILSLRANPPLFPF